MNVILGLNRDGTDQAPDAMQIGRMIRKVG
jgi:hypothetical protein